MKNKLYVCTNCGSPYGQKFLNSLLKPETPNLICECTRTMFVLKENKIVMEELPLDFLKDLELIS